MTDPQKGGLSRRTFLATGAAGAAAVGLGLYHLKRTPPPKPGGPIPQSPVAPQAYTGVGDLWRESWQWDRVVHSSHARANCISTCSWNVFVKNGIAWREEQNAIYEASEPGVPDFNPRQPHPLLQLPAVATRRGPAPSSTTTARRTSISARTPSARCDSSAV